MKLFVKLVALLSAFGLGGCSISQYQEAGDILYTGVRDIRIEGEERSPHAQRTITMVEEQLAYAPDNAIFGSSSWRWPLPLYRPWLYFTYQHDTSWMGRWLHRLGKRPVWVRDVAPVLRARVAERLLHEQGYLGGIVTSSTHMAQDSLSARLSYSVRLGEPYLLDSVAYLSPIYIDSLMELRHAELSELRRGELFARSALEKDRQSLTDRLREWGYYYFTPDYIRYEADTIQTPGAVQMRTIFAPNMPADALRQWRIGQVRVRLLDIDEQRLATDTLELDRGVTTYYSGQLPIRPRVLNQRLRLRPDSLYRYSAEDLTIKSLASIGSFSGLEIQYTPRNDEADTNRLAPRTLDMTVLMRRDKPWDATLGARFLVKSTDFMGPGMMASLSRRNVFGGGETFGLNASGSYEWQVGTNPLVDHSLSLNSYFLNLDASLSVPTLLIPGRWSKYYDFPTTTTLKLAGQRLNRAGYYALNSFTLSASYDWTTKAGHQHALIPLSLSYTSLSHTSPAFESVLAQNPSLGLSLMSQFVPQMSYTYTRDWELSPLNKLWLRLGVSEAGNVSKLFTLAMGKRWDDRQTLLGVPFAQFARAHLEARLTHTIDRWQSLATRLGLGAVYSYGNAQRAPYMEQFFVGGANSIRAFTVRSLGPGAFVPTKSSAYSFMDQVGEAKLEFNIEWRRKLMGSLEGAVFVDAGNVWLLRPDPERPRASLSEIKGFGDWLDQIAVGTGAGLRYDFTYLVVRLDVGIGLHLPYETGRSGWYNIPNFTSGMGVHLAIGYPF